MFMKKISKYPKSFFYSTLFLMICTVVNGQNVKFSIEGKPVTIKEKELDIFPLTNKEQTLTLNYQISCFDCERDGDFAILKKDSSNLTIAMLTMTDGKNKTKTFLKNGLIYFWVDCIEFNQGIKTIENSDRVFQEDINQRGQFKGFNFNFGVDEFMARSGTSGKIRIGYEVAKKDKYSGTKSCEDFIEIPFQIQLKCTEDFEQIKNSSISELCQFLETTINKNCLDKAKKILDSKDKTAWAKAKNSNTVDSYSQYVRSFNNCKYPAIYLNEAKKRIVSIGGEDAYWDSIKDSNKIQDFEEYLKRYQNGRYIEAVKKRIEELKRKWPPKKRKKKKDLYSQQSINFDINREGNWTNIRIKNLRNIKYKSLYGGIVFDDTLLKTDSILRVQYDPIGDVAIYFRGDDKDTTIFLNQRFEADFQNIGDKYQFNFQYGTVPYSVRLFDERDPSLVIVDEKNINENSFSIGLDDIKQNILAMEEFENQEVVKLLVSLGDNTSPRQIQKDIGEIKLEIDKKVPEDNTLLWVLLALGVITIGLGLLLYRILQMKKQQEKESWFDD